MRAVGGGGAPTAEELDPELAEHEAECRRLATERAGAEARTLIEREQDTASE